MSPESKLQALSALATECGSIAVAFSGGLDSAFLLKVTHEALGDRAFALTALSPSYAAIERARAESLAMEWGIVQKFVHANELTDPRYAANPPTRCYFCKTEMYGAMRALLSAETSEAVLCDGTTVDDLKDFRPGQKAATENGVRHLLVEAGLAKAEIRELARAMALPIAELPGTACLSSRFPYGTAITPEGLERIEAAEAVVRALGFRQFRVRDHHPIARVEIAPEELARCFDPIVRTSMSAGLKALGFTYVALELEGYSSGSLNAVVPEQVTHRG